MPDPAIERSGRPSPHHEALQRQVCAMHLRAQLAEGRAERAEKLLRRFTNIHAWFGSESVQQYVEELRADSARFRQALEGLARTGGWERFEAGDGETGLRNATERIAKEALGMKS